MTAAVESSYRSWPQHAPAGLCLEDKFEILKEIGDGSFGSVVLARVRSSGAHIARRGTMIAVKTMKKTFDSFSQCLDLREVIFLRSLPTHAHLVPALDIFLDPLSKKLHIAMEYMDGNLYQLMKARECKSLDGTSVKSILYQILSGLEHIHQHEFFHRDIKPENILVSTSAPQDAGNAGNSFRRYSNLMTPPATPPVYTIKIADFGLARETHSKMPFTTYVSTRWYRAPEVLLRAGEYSAPVDIWAIGAMAVEVATLKPLFPGSNEVDQVWRVCEIMGSPGGWVNKHGVRVGGGEWKEGVKLAQKLGFSFPKMAPHSMKSILTPPQWPQNFCDFVTWCLMWDPKNRPTSTQALNHEYFLDAFDPLRPKSSASRLLGRKQSDISQSTGREMTDSTTSLSSKTSSWFRKSLIARESAPAVPQLGNTVAQVPTSFKSQSNLSIPEQPPAIKSKPPVSKRATWTLGMPPHAAPMPILPSIKPVSPLSDTVHAQAARALENQQKAAKKIGRQLSVASHGNHYTDIHRFEAERALNGQTGLISPPGAYRESFFSHLRKRARRLSGRHQSPMSPTADDVETSAGCTPWSTNRQSIMIDSQSPSVASPQTQFLELDEALEEVSYEWEVAAIPRGQSRSPHPSPSMKRNHSAQQLTGGIVQEHSQSSSVQGSGPVSSRTRRALQMQTYPNQRYETPDEQDELINDVLVSAQKAAKPIQTNKGQKEYTPAKRFSRPNLRHFTTDGDSIPYLTPSPSENRKASKLGNSYHVTPTKPMNISAPRYGGGVDEVKWPTPPQSEYEWATAAAASIFAAQAAHQ